MFNIDFELTKDQVYKITWCDNTTELFKVYEGKMLVNNIGSRIDLDLVPNGFIIEFKKIDMDMVEFALTDSVFKTDKRKIQLLYQIVKSTNLTDV